MALLYLLSSSSLINIFIASVSLICFLFLCSVHVTMIFCICWTMRSAVFFISSLCVVNFTTCFIVTFTTGV